VRLGVGGGYWEGAWMGAWWEVDAAYEAPVVMGPEWTYAKNVENEEEA